MAEANKKQQPEDGRRRVKAIAPPEAIAPKVSGDALKDDAFESKSINKILDELRRKFKSDFPVGKEDPAILADLEARFRYPNLRHYKFNIDSLKRELPEAFRNGKVAWERLARHMYLLSRSVVPNIDILIEQMRLSFPNSFPVGSEKDPQKSAILDVFRHFFPHMCEQASVWGDAELLQYIRETHADEFVANKIDWSSIARSLDWHNNSAGTIITRLKSQFPDAIPIVELNDKQVPAILDLMWQQMEARLPVLPDKEIKMHDMVALGFMEILDSKFPSAFPNGNVNWISLTRQLYREGLSELRSVNRFLDGVVAKFKNEFGDDFPISEYSTKNMRKLLNMLMRNLEHAFSGSEISNDEQQEWVLKQLRHYYRDAFVEGTVNWDKLISEAYVSHSHNKKLKSYYGKTEQNGKMDWEQTRQELKLRGINYLKEKDSQHGQDAGPASTDGIPVETAEVEKGDSEPKDDTGENPPGGDNGSGRIQPGESWRSELGNQVSYFPVIAAGALIGLLTSFILMSDPTGWIHLAALGTITLLAIVVGLIVFKVYPSRAGISLEYIIRGKLHKWTMGIFVVGLVATLGVVGWHLNANWMATCGALWECVLPFLSNGAGSCAVTIVELEAGIL